MRRSLAGIGWTRPRRAVVMVMLVAPLCGACRGATDSFAGARLYVAGTTALERGETERAIVLLERAAERAPNGSEIQNHLGLAYRMAGRDLAARRAFERAIELDCDNRAAHENLAALPADVGR